MARNPKYRKGVNTKMIYHKIVPEAVHKDILDYIDEKTEPFRNNFDINEKIKELESLQKQFGELSQFDTHNLNRLRRIRQIEIDNINVNQ